MAAPKQAVVTKTPSATTTHSTADSFFVTGTGDLVVLDQTLAVVATYPKGTWGSVRSGANT